MDRHFDLLLRGGVPEQRYKLLYIYATTIFCRFGVCQIAENIESAQQFCSRRMQLKKKYIYTENSIEGESDT